MSLFLENISLIERSCLKVLLAKYSRFQHLEDVASLSLVSIVTHETSLIFDCYFVRKCLSFVFFSPD